MVEDVDGEGYEVRAVEGCCVAGGEGFERFLEVVLDNRVDLLEFVWLIYLRHGQW